MKIGRNKRIQRTRFRILSFVAISACGDSNPRPHGDKSVALPTEVIELVKC